MCNMNFNMNNMNNMNNNNFQPNMQNMQNIQNIQNIQNLQNQISLLNNTKRNSVIEALNKTMNLTTPNNNIENPEKEITMFFLLPNDCKIPVKAKLNEKIKDVFERFTNNDCPEQFKNKLNFAIQEALSFDITKEEKTLLEMNIKDKEIIMFLSIEEIVQSEELPKKESKSLLSDEEYEVLIKKWILEYQTNKLLNYLKGLINLDEDTKIPSFKVEIDLSDFEKFVKEKASKAGIEADEHDHKLIYSLTNNDWTCNECKKRYSKTEGKYFCSLCDYNMCDECIENKRYFKIKSFPKNVTPSNTNVKNNVEKSSHHEHKLVYCRTIRSCSSCGWICNICRKDFDLEEWSFYCTLCDFDQCCKCFGITN